MTFLRVMLPCVIVGAAGCMSLQPVQTAAQFIPKKNPRIVWVTYSDNSIVPVAQPRISGDSLIGTWQGLSEPVAIPLREVKLMQAPQRDRQKTTMMAISLGALATLGIVAIVIKKGNAAPKCTVEPQPGVDPC